MFRSSFAPQRRPWLPLFGSLAIHAVVLVGVPMLSSQLAQYYYDDFDWSAYRVEPMKIRIPERIYYAREQEPAESSPRATAASRPGPARPVSGSPPAAPQRRSAAVPKDVEFPPLQTSDSDTAILQPNTSPPSLPVKLPSLAFWARRDPLAPKPPRDKVTLPGRAEQSSPAPKMAAAPSAAVPNREPDAGERNVAASATATSLATAGSSTAPVREQTPEAKSGVFDWIAGQAANLIVVSSTPTRPGAVAEVPAGSRDAQAPAGGGQTAGLSAAGGAASPQSNAATRPTDTFSDRQSLSKSDGTAVSAREAGRRSLAQIAGASRIGAESDAKAIAPPVGGAEAFTRIMNPPDGNFDVVVTQSGDHAGVLGRASVLSGTPVYSVYLRVGDEREWVLEFCLPKAQQPRNSRYEVHVEAADPISAPYPVVTTIPNSIIGLLRSTPLAFHGFITAAGAFRDIMPTQTDGVAQKIAAALDQWRFRPARRERLPVDVEVLLILPATKDRTYAARSPRAQTPEQAADGSW